MNKRYITICAVITTLLAVANAASHSVSCVTVNNERKCTSQESPNGNMAIATGIASSHGTGTVGAGAGTPDNFNTDIKHIGQGSYDNNEAVGIRYPFNPNQGHYANGAVSMGVETGNPFNQNYPQQGQGNYGNGEVAMGPAPRNPFDSIFPPHGHHFQMSHGFYRGPH